MKTRNGFVSNSSSSSFIMVCREIQEAEYDEFLQNGIGNKDIVAVGNWRSEGKNFFHVNQELLDTYFKTGRINFRPGLLYENFPAFLKESPDYCEHKRIVANEIPLNLVILFIEIDFHSGPEYECEEDQ